MRNLPLGVILGDPLGSPTVERRFGSRSATLTDDTHRQAKKQYADGRAAPDCFSLGRGGRPRRVRGPDVRTRITGALVPDLAALLLLSACGTGRPADAAAYDPVKDTSVYDDVVSAEKFDKKWPEPYEETASLADGRDVRLWYSKDGRQLMEQHRAPGDGSWTKPRALLQSEEPDPCQGIFITEQGGAVAAIADFGLSCYDGEPPAGSIAVVGVGDLTEWEVHVTRGFDGWRQLRIVDGGSGGPAAATS